MISLVKIVVNMFDNLTFESPPLIWLTTLGKLQRSPSLKKAADPSGDTAYLYFLYFL